MFLGAESMRGAIQRFVPQAHFITRPRFSDLAYTGAKKLTRLPRRSAIVAFSADDVYGLAELVRRQRGGAAVVLGALSPRTRNAQVALYQSGDVDFLVATDAIGMGINMDVDHVAFSAMEKFDGIGLRSVSPQKPSRWTKKRSRVSKATATSRCACCSTGIPCCRFARSMRCLRHWRNRHRRAVWRRRVRQWISSHCAFSRNTKTFAPWQLRLPQ
jgi:helicase-like protein